MEKNIYAIVARIFLSTYFKQVPKLVLKIFFIACFAFQAKQECSCVPRTGTQKGLKRNNLKKIILKHISTAKKNF